MSGAAGGSASWRIFAVRHGGQILILCLLTGCCRAGGGGGGGAWTESEPVTAVEVAVAVPEVPAESALACFGERIETPVDDHVTLRAIADLDDDGKLDAVLQSSHLDDGVFTSMLSVFLGDGAGGFVPTDLLAIGPLSYSVAVADIDGDAHLDLLANDYKGGAVAIFRGAGDGTFTRGPDVTMCCKPDGISAADLDADGDVDLVIGRYQALEIWTNDGSGGFDHHATLPTGRAPEKPGIVDLDAGQAAEPAPDGHLDLVVVDNDDCTYRVFRGKGGAHFSEAHRGKSCCPPTSVCIGEFNSDGHPDAAWACHNAGVQLATLSGADVVFQLDVLDQVRADRLAVADINGDGHDDLLTFDDLSYDEIPFGQGAWTKVNLLAGNGDASFTGVDQRMWKGQYNTPILADLTGDGRLDLAASNWQGREPGYLVLWPGVACP